LKVRLANIAPMSAAIKPDGFDKFLKILKIYIYSKNPSNPTIARIIAKDTPTLKIIVLPFPPDDTPDFIQILFCNLPYRFSLTIYEIR